MMKTLLSLTAVVLALGSPVASQDVAKGEKVFKKCKACHQVGVGAENKAGPVLNAVVNRPVAAIEGFKYSKTLTAMGQDGAVWTEEELDAFLLKPRSYAKGTAMAFAGLRKDGDRTNLIAYLATFDPDGNAAQ